MADKMEGQRSFSLISNGIWSSLARLQSGCYITQTGASQEAVVGNLFKAF